MRGLKPSCAAWVRSGHLLTSKMPSEAPILQPATEKPHHYTYLKEFRTQQCPLFLQHKCTQHRPFTCFHWHFMNQRRRRPIRKRDGTFNYSADIYCTKYDETSGLCPEGDECPFLHRTAGDTERRYHLRYYKTCTCVHETDARGHCVKNGPHCAFAHGAPDLRPPVYDIRELQSGETLEKPGPLEAAVAASQLEKDRIVNEDPKWNDTNYVLANYKTDQCKRPPRLCRQGYACPSYHNSRDRRRSPKKFKYRSTPCPNVKHGDDWGDPSQCESGDNCPYCHTRTEQQFHPEIYKSTKCNDMVQTGYCPRGPFCAFAHVEQEMTTQRDIPATPDTSLAAFVTNVLPHSDCSNHANEEENEQHSTSNGKPKENLSNTGNGISLSSDTSSSNGNGTVTSNLPEPIGKGRSSSISSTNSDISNYLRAPGSEREDAVSKLRQQMQSIENDATLDPVEKSKRRQNVLSLHNLNATPSLPGSSCGSLSMGSTPTTPSSTVSSTMSPHAPSFYPPGDTVESVIGNALEEDLNLGELSLSSIDRDLARDNDNDSNSVCSSLSTGFPAASNNYFGATSVPVTIPSGGMQRNSISSLSQSPCSSPMGSLPAVFIPQHLQQQQKQEQQLEQAAAAFLSQPNPGKYSAPGYSDYNSMSPRSSISQSPLLGGATYSSSNGYGEIQRLREEITANKAKLSQWEEGILQARNACEAWKKEAEECARKAKIAEDDRQLAYKQRDEALTQIAKMKIEMDQVRGGPFLHCLQRVNELEKLPLALLHQLQKQLRIDIDTLDKIIFQHSAMKCVVCGDRNRCVAVLPCNHCVMCEQCATKRNECPYCHTHITQRSSLVLPM